METPNFTIFHDCKLPPVQQAFHKILNENKKLESEKKWFELDDVIYYCPQKLPLFIQSIILDLFLDPKGTQELKQKINVDYFMELNSNASQQSIFRRIDSLSQNLRKDQSLITKMKDVLFQVGKDDLDEKEKEIYNEFIAISFSFTRNQNFLKELNEYINTQVVNLQRAPERV